MKKSLFYLTLLLIASIGISCSSTSSSKTANPLTEEEKILEEARRYFDRESYTVAKNSFDELLQKFPQTKHAEFARIKRADSVFLLKRYNEAAKLYQEFKVKHPNSEAVPYASGKIAEGKLKRYKGVGKDVNPLKEALREFENLAENHPKSDFISSINKMTTHCKEKIAEHETAIAIYYFKQGNLAAAKSRILMVASNYPETQFAQSLEKKLPKDLMSDKFLIKQIAKTRTQNHTKARLKTPN